ncbi:MAG: tyrosine-type recombinase/integrase [Chloroflexota bacterium]
MPALPVIQRRITEKWTLASLALTDAYTDFILSRQVKQCTPATFEFYKYTTGVFLKWVESQSITSPNEITARYVREYLAGLIGKSDKTIHAHARAIRTLLRFWHEEGYMPAPVKFDMPRMAKKRLPCLTAEQLSTVLSVCDPRDKAIIMVMADSGLRRAEIINLNWGDVDMQSGLVRVVCGKGRKDRSTVIAPTVRRTLLAYRKTSGDHANDAPVFQTRSGRRFTGSGLLQVFRRISADAGIHVTPHALRRTFTILSLRSGADVLHLQAELGHASLDMVQHYAQMVDEDLLQSHKNHSPIENLGRLK